MNHPCTSHLPPAMDVDMDMDDGSSNGSAHDEVFSPRAQGQADSDGDMDGPEKDDDDDAVSISSDSSFKSLVSLTESVFCAREEHGRFYHAYYTNDYMFPDDPKHQWFLEALHNTYYVASGNRLHFCPAPQGPHRVLDMGTGPGSWAVDYASLHPEAHVIGVDISPVQPTLVPENCAFEVDHLEQDDWTWSHPFDLLYWRFLHGCFADPSAVVAKCFENLNPGGYLEMFDGLRLHTGSSVPAHSPLVTLVRLATDAAAARGRPLHTAATYPALLHAAGFQDIHHTEVLWPVNGRTASSSSSSSSSSEQPDLGHYVSHAFSADLEGLFLALLCRDNQPLTYEQTTALCEQARQELRAAPMDAYWVFNMAYGRKPLKGRAVAA